MLWKVKPGWCCLTSCSLLVGPPLAAYKSPSGWWEGKQSRIVSWRPQTPLHPGPMVHPHWAKPRMLNSSTTSHCWSCATSRRPAGDQSPRAHILVLIKRRTTLQGWRLGQCSLLPRKLMPFQSDGLTKNKRTPDVLPRTPGLLCVHHAGSANSMALCWHRPTSKKRCYSQRLGILKELLVSVTIHQVLEFGSPRRVLVGPE